MGMFTSAPSGTSGTFLAVGTASGNDTVPVGVDLGTETRGFTVTARAVNAGGQIVTAEAIGRVVSGTLTWQIVGPLLFDSENGVVLEVPENAGPWAASLRFEFSV